MRELTEVSNEHLQVEIAARKWAEMQVHFQKETLQLLAEDATLEQMLDFLAHSMESQSRNNCLIAIHLLKKDGHHFGTVAAPSLLASYATATKGVDARLQMDTCSATVVSGTPTVVRDFAAETRWLAFTAEMISLGLRACFTTPIFSTDRRILGIFAVYYRVPCDPSPSDRQMAEIVTRTATLVIERKQADALLRESEFRYRSFFNSIDEAFCVIEKLERNAGEPLDFRYIEANPAFTANSGVSDIVGKTILQVVLDEPEEWRLIFDTVLKTGEPIRFERGVVTNGRVLDVYAFRVEDGTRRRVGVVLKDITALRRAEMNHSFLSAISQDLAQLTDPNKLMESVGEKIGSHLGLSLCTFGEINEAADEAVITHDWHRHDMTSLVGVYRLPDFIEEDFIRAARAGEIIVVRNTLTDPRTDPEKFAALKIAALLAVPLIRDGQWRFVLSLYHSTAYDWRGDEIELARELTVRIWTRLERLRSDAELRESEERYRTLLTSMDEGFCIIELLFDEHQKPVDFRYLQINPMFEKQTGLRDAVGKRIRELVPDIEAHWIETYGKVALTGEPIRFANEAKAMDGRWFDVYACRVGGPDSRKVAIIFNDVTARKRAETALRASEQQLRFVMDAIPEKIATTQAQGGHDYFNPQWTEFTGLSFEQLIATGWRQLIHPDDLAESMRIWQHSMDTGERSASEQRIRRADGEYRWHSSQTVPLRDAVSNVLMWVGSSTDIHDAKEAGRRKDEFLALLAHELRNPLAPISYMLEVLKGADGKGELIQPALATMEQQLAQMTRLIDDLLDVSRISTGKLTLRREEINLASVIQRAVEANRPAMESGRHKLTLTLQRVILHADSARLTQVLSNLLNNACKFTPPGGHISLLVEQLEAEAVITVRDSGIGIATDLLPKIFEMFSQGDQTLERAQGGLGIGLALVRRLVEMHNGSVQVFSEGPDRGTEFVVRLPTVIEKTKLQLRAPDSPANKSAPLHAHRILVVDDNHSSAMAMSLLLKQSGYETHTAYDGVAAVAAAEKLRPDVILLDIGMPKLNGYDAARQIREQPWGKTMVLLALTGWGQKDDLRKSAEAGFNGHLVKPVRFPELLKRLEELLA